MDENYIKLVEFISSNSGVSKEEIERRIEAKQAKLAGLISKAGAAQIVAAELNVSFDKQKIKIGEIVPGMKKINLTGKVISLNPIREYNKNGRSGRIASFVLADETSNIRTVLWDENHIDLVGKGEISNNSVVEIINGNLRNGELHLTSFSEIKLSSNAIEKVIVDKPLSRKSIIHFSPNDNVSARAFIVQIFEPKFFEICPECRKKVDGMSECKDHGKVVSEKRALLNFVIDDGTDSIRAVMFSDSLQKIMSNEELENSELFSIKKLDLLGKEVFISGQVRRNNVFNNNEFIINNIEDIDLDRLIVELEK